MKTLKNPPVCLVEAWIQVATLEDAREANKRALNNIITVFGNVMNAIEYINHQKRQLSSSPSSKRHLEYY